LGRLAKLYVMALHSDLSLPILQEAAQCRLRSSRFFEPCSLELSAASPPPPSDAQRLLESCYVIARLGLGNLSWRAFSVLQYCVTLVSGIAGIRKTSIESPQQSKNQPFLFSLTILDNCF